MAWEVPIKVGDEEYPVTFNTENEPTEADINEAVAQITKGQIQDPAPVEKATEPMLDISDTLKATGQALGGLPTTAPHAYRQLSEGLNNPWERSPEYTQSKSEMAKYAADLEQSNLEAEKSGDISSFSRGMRQAGPSLGFSAGAMGSSVAGGSAAGTAGRYIGALAGPEGAVAGELVGRGVGALGASYGAAYRMAGAQFLDDAREAIDEKFQRLHKRLPTKDEQVEAYKELLPLAEAFGHAEAGPEAIGNLAMGGAGRFVFGLGKKKIVQLADSALKKATMKAGAAAGALGTEFAGETATQVEQSRIDKEAKALIAGESPPELTDRTVEDYQKAFGEVAPATAATTLLMGGAGAALGGAKRLMTAPEEKEGVQVSPSTLPESAGLGRPVVDVIAESDALSAQAAQQAVAADSPLMAEAIVENAAAPTPEADKVAETGTTEPVVQEPGAAREEVNEAPDEQEVKATNNSRLARFSDDELQARWQIADTRSQELGNPMAPVWADEAKMLSQEIGLRQSQQSPQAVTTNDAATPLEQGGSDAFAGEPRTPPEGSIPDVTVENVPDNKPLSNTEPIGQGARGADTESVTNNLPPDESDDIGAGMKEGNKQQAQPLTQEEAKKIKRLADDLSFSGVGVIDGVRYAIQASPDGSFYIQKTTNGAREALALGQPDIETANQVAIQIASDEYQKVSEPSSTKESANKPQPPKSVGSGKEAEVSSGGMSVEEAKAYLKRPGQILGFDEKTFLDSQRHKGKIKPAAVIANNLQETADPETVASQARQREREAISEERKQRGDEKPITDSKAPVAQGEFVTWQAEDGTMREGVLTKTSAGRNSAGEAVSEVTLESSEVVQVPRRELQALASERTPAQQARADAIKSIRGTLGTELSTGVSAVDAINGATDLQGQVPGVQKAWVGTREDFLADEKLGKSFPQVKRALESSKGDRLEGLFSAGRAFVFTDQVGIYEGDVASAAEQEDTTPGQAAVQRVITHEALVHRGFYALDKPTRHALFQWGAQNIYEGEMDAKAEEYGSGADWRTNVDSREFLLEEIMAKMIERLKAPPKSGPLKQLWDILAAIWRKLSGKSREVTLKDVQDVAKLLRTALELAENNVETRSGMPIKVGVPRASYAGEKAEMTQFMRDSLDTAKAMAAAGKTSEEIRAVTGWFPGKYDGKMRWEVPDEEAKIDTPKEIADIQSDLNKTKAEFQEAKNNGGSNNPDFYKTQLKVGNLENRLSSKMGDVVILSEMLDHPALFEAYPEAAKIPVRYELRLAANGQFEPRSKSIVLNERIRGTPDGLSVLLHEVQHWIQDKEGFPQGTNAWYEQIAVNDALMREKYWQQAAMIRGRADERGISEQEAQVGLAAEMDWKWEDGWLRRSKNSAEDIQTNLTAAQSVLAKTKSGEQAYRNNAGEIEARDIQARQKFTPEQRKATEPYSSENIAKEDAIVMGVHPSLRPQYTTPLDQTLANTAKAVRLMRDGPPALPVNMQQVYQAAQGVPERVVAAALKDPRTGKIFTGATHGDANPRDKTQLDLGAAKDPQAFIGHITNTGRWVSAEEAENQWGIMGSESSAAYWADPLTHDAVLGRGEEDDRWIDPMSEEDYQAELARRIEAEANHQPVKASIRPKSAMVSLDDLFATAKQVHPDLTEAEFGQQVQALYDDNGAYIEPAESVDVMKADGEKYGVRTSQGIPATYAMVLDDEPVRASLRGERDAGYMQAVHRGDVAKQQAMVDAAAKAAGQRKLFHVGRMSMPSLHHTKATGGVGEVFLTEQPAAWAATLERESDPQTQWFLSDAKIAKTQPSRQKLVDWAINRGFMEMKPVTKPDGSPVFELDDKTPLVKPTETLRGRSLPFYSAQDPMRGGNQQKHLIYAFLKESGFAAYESEYSPEGHEVAVFDPNAIKSADPVTRDAAGNVVPLSQRFNQATSDIRYSLRPETITRLNHVVEAAQNASGDITDSEQTPIKDRPVHTFAQQSGEARVDAAVQIVDALEADGTPKEELVDVLTGYELHKQLGIEKDPDMLSILLAEAMRRGAPGAFAAYEVTRERAGRALGSGAMLHSHPRYQHMFVLNGIKNEHQQQATDIAEANADIKADEVKKLDAESSQTAAKELAESAEEVAFRAGEESLSAENKTLWQKILNVVTRLGFVARVLAARKAKNASEAKPSFRGTISQAEIDELNSMSDDQLAAEEKRLQDEFQSLAKAFMGKDAKPDDAEKLRKQAERRLQKRKEGIFSPADNQTFNRLMDSAHKRSGDKSPMLPENISWTKLFSGSPQSQEAKAKQMMEYMKQDPVLSNLDPAEQQELADMFSKRWEAKREELTAAKVAAVLKRRFATEKGKQAVKGAIPKFIQAINRGELNNDIIAQDIAEKFGFEKLTDAENKKLETLAKELQEPNISVHDRRAKTDEIVKIIARKTGLSTAEILSAWWVTSVLSGPRTIFTIGMAFLSGGFEVFTHAAATVINAHLQGRRGEGTEAAMQSLTNYFESYPRAVQLAWQYVRTGDKNLLADSDPAFMQFFDTGRNNPQSIGWRMTQSKNPATRMLGRFMHFFEKMLTAGDLFNSTITRHGMLPVAQFLNSKTYEKARVASETDLSNYRKKALNQWWGDEEPKTWQQQALVTRQSIDLMETELAKYANVLENANFVAAQGAMTLNPEGLGGKAYRAIRGIANRAETSSAKTVKAADMLKAEKVGAINKKTQQVIAFLYHFATHQMLNLGGLRFARFAGNKLNQSIGFIPMLGLARLYEKDYAGQMKQQAIIKNQVIGAVIAMVGITILKAISDEPDDDKRGWGIEGSWAGLSAAKIKQLMAAGRKQNSIHFGGNTFNYANWPISSMLAAIGAMADRIKYDPEDWEKATTPEVAYTGLWAAMSSTFDTTALSQLSEILGSNVHSRDPVDASMKKVSRVFGNFAGGFIPRVLKDIDLMGDGNLRKYEGWENFAKEVPYYRRYVGGPLLDIFAQQVEVSRTPWSREYQAQPEAREYQILGQMGSNGLWLTPADPGNRRVGKGRRSREMTDAEQKRFVSIVGENYRQLVLKHGDRLNSMKHEAAKDMLGKLSDVARDRAERAALVAPPEAQP